MAYFYAQLNDENICTCVSQLTNEVIKSNLIKIDKLDADLQGRKYDNGQWSVEKYIEELQSTEMPQEAFEPTPPQPTNAEIKELLLINTQIQLEAAEDQRQASLLQIGIALETAELILGGIQS